MNSKPCNALPIEPDPVAVIALCAAAAVVAAALWLANVPAWLGVAGSLTVLSCAVGAVRAWGRQSTIYVVYQHNEPAVRVYDGAGHCRVATVHFALLSPWLVIVHLRPTDGPAERLIVCPTSVGTRRLRRLRLWGMSLA